MRHITGNLFDENKQKIPLLEELQMWKEIYHELLEEYPFFQFKMIISGHKWYGKKHVDLMLEHIKQITGSSDPWISEFICGFDLINEEDITPQICTYTEQIVKAK